MREGKGERKGRESRRRRKGRQEPVLPIKNRSRAPYIENSRLAGPLARGQICPFVLGFKNWRAARPNV